MATSRLAKALAGHGLIALDTCVLIYHLEGHEQFGPPSGEVLTYIQDGRCQAVLSTFALLELQVGPYRGEAGDLADRYYAALTALPNVRWVPLTYQLADRAAQVRAQHDIATPNAIHLATAIDAGATLFVTNDQSMPDLPNLEYAYVGV